jgi:hypothetical protein
MKPSKPFLIIVAALVALGTTIALSTGTAAAAAAQSAMPLSTALTPGMIDYFGVRDVYTRPSIATLVQCAATRACGSADSSRVHHCTEVRFLENDPRYVWPLTDLVVMELSNATGEAPQRALRTEQHAAVSFDGTRYAHVLTTDALVHRVDLQVKRLEATMPDR